MPFFYLFTAPPPRPHAVLPQLVPLTQEVEAAPGAMAAASSMAAASDPGGSVQTSGVQTSEAAPP